MVDALERYVNSFGLHGKGVADSREISKLIETLGEVIDDDIVVYRGQGASKIRSDGWISTSYDDGVIRRFAGVDCCIFKITLKKGARILDVDKTLKEHGRPNKYAGEQEVLVLLEGGTFSEQENIGTQSGKTLFHIVFTPKITASTKKITPEEMLKQLDISAEDREFIDSPEDLGVYGVPPSLREDVFRLLKTGGAFTVRHRRHRTRRFRGRAGTGRVRSSNSKTARRAFAGSAGRNAGRGLRFSGTGRQY